MPDVLEQLAARIDRLSAAMADLVEEQQRLQLRLLRDEDRKDIGRLLPLVHKLVGERAWTATEIFSAALNDPQASELQGLLASWASPSAGLRSFGWFLDRTSGCTVCGLRLNAVGARERDGKVYQVKRVSGASKVAPAVVSESSHA